MAVQQEFLSSSSSSSSFETEDTSLIALSSHFAQVQFRLKQITSSPPELREKLLEDLETFAFQACPVKLGERRGDEEGSRQQQSLSNLLDHLQLQMSRASSKEGTPSCHTSSPSTKEGIVMDEVKKRFDSKFDDDGKVNETKKDEMVRQLAGQVRSMEEYITTLQHELLTLSGPPTGATEQNSSYKVTWCQGPSTDDLIELHRVSSEESINTCDSKIRTSRGGGGGGGGGDKHVKALERTIIIMKLLTLWQCGGVFNCLPNSSSELSNKPAAQQPSPSALRGLELSVDKISILTTTLTQPTTDSQSCIKLESSLHDEVTMNLSDSLRELLEDGWEGLSKTTPTFCIPPLKGGGVKLQGDTKDCLAWRTLIHYYNLKKGSKICEKPHNRLSSSFSIPLDNATPPKKTLLSVIHRTEKAFVGCRKYSSDLKFRSLVAEGFNLRHLSDWMKLLINHPTLSNDIYSPSSFINTTRFRPVIQCLDRLSCVPAVDPVELPSSFYHHTNSYFSQ